MFENILLQLNDPIMQIVTTVISNNVFEIIH